MGAREVEFPVDWKYRIIVGKSAADDCLAGITTVLQRYGIAAVPQQGRDSANGKYQAYSLNVTFDSKRMMDSLSEDLAAVPGVKFLL